MRFSPFSEDFKVHSKIPEIVNMFCINNYFNFKENDYKSNLVLLQYTTYLQLELIDSSKIFFMFSFRYEKKFSQVKNLELQQTPVKFGGHQQSTVDLAFVSFFNKIVCIIKIYNYY